MESDKLFYPGQEITKVVEGNWCLTGTHTRYPGPKMGEVVKVKRYGEFYKGNWYIAITGYTDTFKECCFAPVITDSQLEEMLQEVDQLIVTHGTF